MKRMRRGLGALILGILCMALLPMTAAAGNSRAFPETGQTSDNAFYDFWFAHGQTEVLGLPLSPTFIDADDVVIQIYERAVMEWHPENDQPNRVQLERLGVNYLDNIVDSRTMKPQGSVHQAEPPRSCTNSLCRNFPQTKHTVKNAFYDYWVNHGGVASFGYPLTEEFDLATFDGGGKTFTVQYFERNRLEYHPEIKGGTILLGRLGAPIWDDLKPKFTGRANVIVPDYTSTAPYIEP